MKQFTHLHVHTEYSTLDGINKVSTVPKLMKEQGHTALAITDHGTIAGTFAFYESCIKADIKPILGMEAYYTVVDHTVKEPDDLGANYYHLVLLAQNNNGFHNLIKLSSYALRCSSKAVVNSINFWSLISEVVCLSDSTSNSLFNLVI